MTLTIGFPQFLNNQTSIILPLIEICFYIVEFIILKTFLFI